MKGFMRKLLKTIARLVIGLAVTMVLVIAIGICSNQRAAKAAAQFCDQIPVGSELQQSVHAADASGVRYLEALHEFHFPGWVFNVAVCAVTVEGGKVVGTRVEGRGD